MELGDQTTKKVNVKVKDELGSSEQLSAVTRKYRDEQVCRE